MRKAADPKPLADLRLAFRQAVNMTPAEIESWLARPESLTVGTIRPGENESVGRQYGRRIIALHGVRALTPEHAATMRKVIGYVRRHAAQRPRGDITRTRWRFALMNWGHDPVKRELGID